MRLYELDENIVTEVIKNGIKNIQQSGRVEYSLIIESFLYPVKVICKEEQNKIVVITCYLVKKGIGNEN